MKLSFAALGLLALLAAPAQAQSMGFPFPDPDNEGLGPWQFGRGSCFTEHELRNYLEDKGYTHVLFGVFDSARVPVKATMDGFIYLMDVNYCSGRIVSKRQFKPA